MLADAFDLLDVHASTEGRFGWLEDLIFEEVVLDISRRFADLILLEVIVLGSHIVLELENDWRFVFDVNLELVFHYWLDR